MKRLIPSPSMAVAVTALFVALSGSSYAAVTLHKNSVTSREIKDRSVRLADLSPTVRPSKNNKLFRKAVTDTVLDPSTQAAVEALAGAVKGGPGATGATGAQGATGPAAVAKREAVGPDVGAGADSGAKATCQPGEKVVGGGARFEASQGNGGAFLTMSQPADGEQAWSANYSTGQFTAGHTRVFALCAS